MTKNNRSRRGRGYDEKGILEITRYDPKGDISFPPHYCGEMHCFEPLLIEYRLEREGSICSEHHGLCVTCFQYYFNNILWTHLTDGAGVNFAAMMKRFVDRKGSLFKAGYNYQLLRTWYQNYNERTCEKCITGMNINDIEDHADRLVTLRSKVNELNKNSNFLCGIIIDDLLQPNTSNQYSTEQNQLISKLSVLIDNTINSKEDNNMEDFLKWGIWFNVQEKAGLATILKSFHGCRMIPCSLVGTANENHKSDGVITQWIEIELSQSLDGIIQADQGNPDYVRTRFEMAKKAFLQFLCNIKHKVDIRATDLLSTMHQSSKKDDTSSKPSAIDKASAEQSDLLQKTREYYSSIRDIVPIKPSGYIHPLTNIKQQCYLIVIMHLFALIVPIRDWYLNDRFVPHSSVDNNNKNVIVEWAVHLLLRKMLDNTQSTSNVDTGSLFQALDHVRGLDTAEAQFDCTEALTFLLQCLEEATDQPTATEQPVGLQNVGGHSPLKHLMVGTCATTTCTACNTISTKQEKPGYVIQLGIQRGNKTLHLHRLLEEEYCKEEELSKDNAVTCGPDTESTLHGHCNNTKEVGKRRNTLSINPSNSLLFIALKRSQMSGNGRFSKIRRKIDFPFDLDMRKYTTDNNGDTYKLVGVINHSGQSIRRGHYYLYARVGDCWYVFDDDVRHQLQEDKVVTRDASALVYCKASMLNEVMASSISPTLINCEPRTGPVLRTRRGRPAATIGATKAKSSKAKSVRAEKVAPEEKAGGPEPKDSEKALPTRQLASDADCGIDEESSRNSQDISMSMSTADEEKAPPVGGDTPKCNTHATQPSLSTLALASPAAGSGKTSSTLETDNVDMSHFQQEADYLATSSHEDAVSKQFQTQTATGDTANDWEYATSTLVEEMGSNPTDGLGSYPVSTPGGIRGGSEVGIPKIMNILEDYEKLSPPADPPIITITSEIMNNKDDHVRIPPDVMSSFMNALSSKLINDDIIICGGNITMKFSGSEVAAGCEEEVQNILSPFKNGDNTSLCWWFLASFKNGFNYCWMMMRHPINGSPASVTYYPADGGYATGWSSQKVSRFKDFILYQTGCSFDPDEYEIIRSEGVSLDKRMDAIRGYGIVNEMIESSISNFTDDVLVQKIKDIEQEGLDVPKLAASYLSAILSPEYTVVFVHKGETYSPPTTAQEWSEYNVDIGPDDSGSDDDKRSSLQAFQAYVDSLLSPTTNDSSDSDSEEEEEDHQRAATICGTSHTAALPHIQFSPIRIIKKGESDIKNASAAESLALGLDSPTKVTAQHTKRARSSPLLNARVRVTTNKYRDIKEGFEGTVVSVYHGWCTLDNTKKRIRSIDLNIVEPPEGSTWTCHCKPDCPTKWPFTCNSKTQRPVEGPSSLPWNYASRKREYDAFIEHAPFFEAGSSPGAHNVFFGPDYQTVVSDYMHNEPAAVLLGICIWFSSVYYLNAFVDQPFHDCENEKVEELVTIQDYVIQHMRTFEYYSRAKNQQVSQLLKDHDGKIENGIAKWEEHMYCAYKSNNGKNWLDGRKKDVNPRRTFRGVDTNGWTKRSDIERLRIECFVRNVGICIVKTITSDVMSVVEGDNDKSFSDESFRSKIEEAVNVSFARGLSDGLKKWVNHEFCVRVSGDSRLTELLKEQKECCDEDFRHFTQGVHDHFEGLQPGDRLADALTMYRKRFGKMLVIRFMTFKTLYNAKGMPVKGESHQRKKRKTNKLDLHAGSMIK